MNTETPETDALWDRYLKGDIITTRDLFDFARKTAREREEAREKLANAIYDLADEHALADRLADAIQLAITDSESPSGHYFPAVLTKFRAALTSWKEARK